MSSLAKSILVIEPNPAIRELLHELLESNGFRTLSTDHCLDPEDVQQLRPSAMLIDPFFDRSEPGWEYLQLLRAQPGLQHLPIVMCTSAHEQLRDVTASHLALITNTVLKPFDIDELLQALSSAAGIREGTQPYPWLAQPEAELHDAQD